MFIKLLYKPAYLYDLHHTRKIEKEQPTAAPFHHLTNYNLNELNCKTNISIFSLLLL